MRGMQLYERLSTGFAVFLKVRVSVRSWVYYRRKSLENSYWQETLRHD